MILAPVSFIKLSPPHSSFVGFSTLCLNQGRIQEFFIGGVQTLVQKGLLNFFAANYFSAGPPQKQNNGKSNNMHNISKKS